MNHDRAATLLTAFMPILFVLLFHAGESALGQTGMRLSAADDPKQQGQTTIRFFYDPKPESGVPRETLFARSSANPNQPNENEESAVLKSREDEKNHGALRNVIGWPISAIKIRYFDSKTFDQKTAESSLKAVIESRTGDTYAHIFWAERLGVPMIEAYLYADDVTPSNAGYLLVWANRAVYRDAKGKWWFTSMPQYQWHKQRP